MKPRRAWVLTFSEPWATWLVHGMSHEIPMPWQPRSWQFGRVFLIYAGTYFDRWSARRGTITTQLSARGVRYSEAALVGTARLLATRGIVSDSLRWVFGDELPFVAAVPLPRGEEPGKSCWPASEQLAQLARGAYRRARVTRE